MEIAVVNLGSNSAFSHNLLNSQKLNPSISLGLLQQKQFGAIILIRGIKI